MAPAGSEIVLYDLTSKPTNKCWSPNTWKIRLILNYKKVPYRTEWLEYPDIRKTIESLGVEPNPVNKPGDVAFTCPTVDFQDGKVVMESAAIAAELEKRYPDSPIAGIPTQPPKEDSEQATSTEFLRLYPAMAEPLRPTIGTRIVEHIVNQASYEYRKNKLEKMVGMSLEEIKAGIDLDKAFAQVQAPIKELDALFAKEDGPFSLGERLGWADVQLIGKWQFLRACGEDLWERLMALEGIENLNKVYQTAEKNGWLERDNH